MVQLKQRPSAADVAPSKVPAVLAQQPKRRLGVGILAGVALLAVGTAALRLGPWNGAGRDVTPYVVEASRGSLAGVITASGELQAIRRVNVSPRKQGLLQELRVDEGDTVQKGDVLAVMDPGDFNDRLSERQALLREAEASYRSREDEFLRRQQLYRQGVISAIDFNRIRNQRLASEAALIAARERVQQLDTEGRELLIRAPFSGTITRRFAEPGAFVTPTTTASATAGASSSSIVELSQGLEIVARVPESDIGRVKQGQTATVRVDAYPDQRFEAEVHEIAPRAEKTDNVISFDVKLRFRKPAATLLIGMTADVDFQTGRSALKTLVPTVAIVTEAGEPGVLLIGKDQQPTFTPVELGSSSGDQTAILNGVEPGTRVFIDLPPWAAQSRD
ncbi:MAG: efflux RND transporter periplasmic adaptor subunit [Synechococcus sp.]